MLEVHSFHKLHKKTHHTCLAGQDVAAPYLRLSFDDTGDHFVCHLPVLFELCHIALELLLDGQAQYLGKDLDGLPTTSDVSHWHCISSSAFHALTKAGYSAHRLHVLIGKP